MFALLWSFANGYIYRKSGSRESEIKVIQKISDQKKYAEKKKKNANEMRIKGEIASVLRLVFFLFVPFSRSQCLCQTNI